MMTDVQKQNTLRARIVPEIHRLAESDETEGAAALWRHYLAFLENAQATLAAAPRTDEEVAACVIEDRLAAEISRMLTTLLAVLPGGLTELAEYAPVRERKRRRW